VGAKYHNATTDFDRIPPIVSLHLRFTIHLENPNLFPLHIIGVHMKILYFNATIGEVDLGNAEDIPLHYGSLEIPKEVMLTTENIEDSSEKGMIFITENLARDILSGQIHLQFTGTIKVRILGIAIQGNLDELTVVEPFDNIAPNYFPTLGPSLPPTKPHPTTSPPTRPHPSASPTKPHPTTSPPTKPPPTSSPPI